MQQQLFGMLQPATLVPGYSNDTSILYTNRLRLNVDSRINDDLSVTARLSMYKAWAIPPAYRSSTASPRR